MRIWRWCHSLLKRSHGKYRNILKRRTNTHFWVLICMFDLWTAQRNVETCTFTDWCHGNGKIRRWELESLVCLCVHQSAAPIPCRIGRCCNKSVGGLSLWTPNVAAVCRNDVPCLDLTALKTHRWKDSIVREEEKLKTLHYEYSHLLYFILNNADSVPNTPPSYSIFSLITHASYCSAPLIFSLFHSLWRETIFPYFPTLDRIQYSLAEKHKYWEKGNGTKVSSKFYCGCSCEWRQLQLQISWTVHSVFFFPSPTEIPMLQVCRSWRWWKQEEDSFLSVLIQY